MYGIGLAAGPMADRELEVRKLGAGTRVSGRSGRKKRARAGVPRRGGGGGGVSASGAPEAAGLSQKPKRQSGESGADYRRRVSDWQQTRKQYYAESNAAISEARSGAERKSLLAQTKRLGLEAAERDSEIAKALHSMNAGIAGATAKRRLFALSFAQMGDLGKTLAMGDGNAIALANRMDFVAGNDVKEIRREKGEDGVERVSFINSDGSVASTPLGPASLPMSQWQKLQTAASLTGGKSSESTLEKEMRILRKAYPGKSEAELYEIARRTKGESSSTRRAKLIADLAKDSDLDPAERAARLAEYDAAIDGQTAPAAAGVPGAAAAQAEGDTPGFVSGVARALPIPEGAREDAQGLVSGVARTLLPGERSFGEAVARAGVEGLSRMTPGVGPVSDIAKAGLWAFGQRNPESSSTDPSSVPVMSRQQAMKDRPQIFRDSETGLIIQMRGTGDRPAARTPASQEDAVRRHLAEVYQRALRLGGTQEEAKAAAMEELERFRAEQTEG